MILNFPGKENVEGQFYMKYNANCKLLISFNDDLSQNEIKEFVDNAVDRTWIFLGHHFIDIECFDEIYYKFDSEKIEIDYDNYLITIPFNLVLDSEMTFDKGQKREYQFRGDAWASETQIEGFKDFISYLYNFELSSQIDDYNVLQFFKGLYMFPEFIVDTFEIRSFIGVPPGYDYEDVW